MATKPSRHAVVSLLAVLVGSSCPASAEVTFEWVAVGNAGNGADPLNSGSVPGIGSVTYNYRIAKHEVTHEQYAEFLNAVAATDTNSLYAGFMQGGSGGILQSGSPGSFTYSTRPNMSNKPVNWVSFFDAMRFVNWLHNGQPTGLQDSTTTENGVYTISDGVSEARAAAARFFIPTENEWYKAAYHQPLNEGGDTDDYWLYATRSNSLPTIATANSVGDISNPGANVANHTFGADWNGENQNVTTVGSAGALSDSFHGTADQSGNIWEFTETLGNDPCRHTRGGSFSHVGTAMQSSLYNCADPTFAVHYLGFRVASPASVGDIPTVSTWGLIVLTLAIAVAGTSVLRRARVG